MSDATVAILHLEDDPLDSELAADLLRQEGIDVTIQRVQALAEFEKALGKPDLQLIISDYTVPGTNVLDALRLAHQRRAEVPFIFLSGTIREDLAIETLKAGATDYVFKEHLNRLVPAVRRALHEAEEQKRRRASEEVLARTTARFDGVISSAMDAIISIDSKQNIVLFNPAAEKMFGAKAAEAVGQSINRFIPQRFREKHARDVQEFGHTGVSNRAMGSLGALTALRATGEEFPIEASISQVEVQGEKLFTVILRDITERQKAQESLQRAKNELAQINAELEKKVQQRTAQLVEANANLQTFAYTAAHDLRAPLRSIRNFSKIVVEDFAPKLGEEGQGLLERVTIAADQMSRLLDSLLEYSKVSAADVEIEPVNLQGAVLEALAMVEQEVREKKAELEVVPPFPEIVGHSASVVLLINNFVANALKFVAPNVPPRVRLWADRSGPWVRLNVQDNGIGIDERDQEKLFGVFKRLQGQQVYPGSGLGLAIARKAAERMGGRVGLHSKPGQGSRFWVELKAASTPQ